MGTQQILLIVLSVIIVGVAIAVGITMFRNQAYNSNKTAVAGELQTYASQVVQWYKTPLSQGGVGSPADLTADPDGSGPLEAQTAAELETSVSAYIGFDTTGKTSSDTGDFEITSVTGTTIEITGIGKEKKGTTNPQGVATITFPACTIATVLTDV